MAILLKSGAIFLHIPKTAGSFFEKFFFEAGLVESKIGHKHATYDRVVLQGFNAGRDMGDCSTIKVYLKNKRLLQNIQDRFFFTFVRSPYSWYCSWFNYQSRSDRNWMKFGRAEAGLRGWHPCAPLNDVQHESFEIFVNHVCEIRPGFLHELYSQYTPSGVTFVGKQETLIDDGKNLLIDLDEARKIPTFERFSKKKINASSEVAQWTKKSSDLIRHYEAPAIKRFGYE